MSRHTIEIALRHEVWDKGSIVTGHPWWHAYSRAVSVFQNRYTGLVGLERPTLVKLAQPYDLKTDYEYLMFSGGLDSVYAHFKHPDMRLVCFDRNRPDKFWKVYPAEIREGRWIGLVELGGPAMLLHDGVGKVYFAADQDGTPYPETRWPQHPTEMPDMFPQVMLAWTKYTGQAVNNAPLMKSKPEMVAELSREAPHLLKHSCSCMNGEARNEWCGRCVKCMLVGAAYELVAMEPPIRFEGMDFRDLSFQMAFQRQGALDTIDEYCLYDLWTKPPWKGGYNILACKNFYRIFGARVPGCLISTK